MLLQVYHSEHILVKSLNVMPASCVQALTFCYRTKARSWASSPPFRNVSALCIHYLTGFILSGTAGTLIALMPGNSEPIYRWETGKTFRIRIRLNECLKHGNKGLANLEKYFNQSLQRLKESKEVRQEKYSLRSFAFCGL